MMNQERILKIALGLSLLALAGTGYWAFRRPRSVDLPDYGHAPDFTLTAQDGQAFDSAALKGKVWVASFVYSTCKTSCPMLAAQMKRLYDAMPASRGFALASFSVDPERDTPQRLAAYARGLGVEDQRWVFLTGKKAYMRQIVVEGFKLAAEPGMPNSEGDILHSSKLVLVDAGGHIRGYFDGTLSDSADEIKRAAEQLIEDAQKK